MRSILFLLLSLMFLLSQETIHVFRFQFDKESAVFEEKILSGIIDMVNVKEGYTFKLLYHEEKSFKNLFSKLNEKKYHDNGLSISSITINDKRKLKYDFSPRYLPIRYAIVALKKNKEINWKAKKHKVGYIIGTTDEKFVKKYQSQYHFKIMPYNNSSEKILALKNGDIDIILSEIVSTFKDKELVIIDNILLEDYGYGIMFPKNSKLVALFKPYIEYYSNSKKYYRLLRKSYGNDIAKILHHEIKRKK